MNNERMIPPSLFFLAFRCFASSFSICAALCEPSPYTIPPLPPTATATGRSKTHRSWTSSRMTCDTPCSIGFSCSRRSRMPSVGKDGGGMDGMNLEEASTNRQSHHINQPPSPINPPRRTGGAEEELGLGVEGALLQPDLVAHRLANRLRALAAELFSWIGLDQIGFSRGRCECAATVPWPLPLPLPVLLPSINHTTPPIPSSPPSHSLTWRRARRPRWRRCGAAACR